MIGFRFSILKKTQAAAVVLKASGGRMQYMRLLKLLYIADREAMRGHGVPIVGSRAVAMKRGPLHSDVYNIVKGSYGDGSAPWDASIRTSGHYVELTADPGDGELSSFEEQQLRIVTEKYAKVSTWALVDITHTFPEWERNYLENTSVTIPDEHILEAVGRADQVEQLAADAQEMRRIHALFGD